MAEVHVVKADGVMRLTLGRPAKKNALTTEMYRLLDEAFAEASRDAGTAAVMIAGEGGDFCAGNDIGDFLAPGGADAAFRFIRTLAGFDKPLVAAVQGLAIGIGTTLLLHCDLVYAAPDARFIVPFVGLGLVPEAASSLLLPARIGRAKAAAMLLLGEPMDAAAADAAGLLSGIVPVEALGEHARGKAIALSRVPPQALAMTRGLIRPDPAAVAQRIAEEADLFAVALASAEAQSAIAGFLARKAPARSSSASAGG